MKKNNIIFFCPSIHTGGGTERVLINLANNLKEDNYQIKILTNELGTNKLFDLNSEIKVEKYWFGELKSKHPKSILLKAVNKLFGKMLLQQFLSKQVDNSNHLIISFSAGITNECAQTSFSDKLISFEHYPNWAYDKHPKVQQQIKENYPKLKKVITLTEHESKTYKRIGCKVTKIPNAYSFFPDTAAPLINKKVLSVGHFNEAKRRDLLIYAWSKVARRYPDWELIIVGDGPEKENCIDLINTLGLNDSIKIEPPTKNIVDYYSNASVFVLSSEFETLPLVLIEARVCGLPCVSFDIVSGPNEIINNERDGFLVPFPNTDLMAEKICTLINNISLRTKFGTLARKDAHEKYNPETIYPIWSNFLSTC